MKTKILIGVGAALLLLLNAFAFSSYARYPAPEPVLDPALQHCYQAFAGCNYMPGYDGYCTERTTATHCTRDYVYCTQCIPWNFDDPPRGDDTHIFIGEIIEGGPSIEGWEANTPRKK